MKILWLAPFPLQSIDPTEYKSVTGTGNWLINLSKGFQEYSNLEIHVITHSARVESLISKQAGNVFYYIIPYRFPFLSKGFPSYFRLDAFTRYKALRVEISKLVEAIQPKIIHAHGTEGAYGLAAIDHLKQYPVVCSIQGIMHHIHSDNSTLFGIVQKRHEKRVVEGLRHFGCRTEWDKSFIKSMNPKAQVHYLPEALDQVYFDTAWNGKDSKTIVFVGSIIKRKGIEDLIKSIAKVRASIPDVRLIVIGSGNWKYIKYLESLIDSFNLTGSVDFKGHLNPTDIAMIHGSSGAYVLPTYSDNSPNALCEAMAVGMPVVAYSTGGVGSLIRNKVDGCLVEKGNEIELEEAIIFALNNRDRLKMAKEARNTAASRNQRGYVAKMTLDSYLKIIRFEGK